MTANNETYEMMPDRPGLWARARSSALTSPLRRVVSHQNSLETCFYAAWLLLNMHKLYIRVSPSQSLSSNLPRVSPLQLQYLVNASLIRLIICRAAFHTHPKSPTTLLLVQTGFIEKGSKAWLKGGNVSTHSAKTSVAHKSQATTGFLSHARHLFKVYVLPAPTVSSLVVSMAETTVYLFLNI